MAKVKSLNLGPGYQRGTYTASGSPNSPQMDSGEHHSSTSQVPSSFSTSIESGDNLLDVDDDPESFYKYSGKKFSLGPSSLIPRGDIEVGKEAKAFNAGFKIVDEKYFLLAQNKGMRLMLSNSS
jgi:hypothetical protein